MANAGDALKLNTTSVHIPFAVGAKFSLAPYDTATLASARNFFIVLKGVKTMILK